jgi:hypothetical protein
MTGFLFFIAMFVFFIAFATVAFQLSMRKHRSVSRQEFICTFAGTGMPAAIPAAVYDYYNQKKVIFKAFRVASDGSYEYVLSMAKDGSYEYALKESEEDIDEDARFLMKNLGLKPPSEDVLLHRTNQIQTLHEMVLWLDWVRQHQPNQA